MSRYREVRETLEKEIASGVFPVGERFPTDLELCERFGVSRHTVREALRELQDSGVLTRQRGLGTIVQAQPTQTYRQTIGNLQALESYAVTAHFERRSDNILSVRGDLATLLGCEPDERWLRLAGVRRLKDQDTPLCWTEIFVASPFLDLRDRLREAEGPLYDILRQERGVTVDEVEQQISAVAIPAEVAEQIACDAGSPGLLIRRRYFTRGEKTPFEISIGLYPAGRYAYTARLSRESGVASGL